MTKKEIATKIKETEDTLASLRKELSKPDCPVFDDHRAYVFIERVSKEMYLLVGASYKGHYRFQASTEGCVTGWTSPKTTGEDCLIHHSEWGEVREFANNLEAMKFIVLHEGVYHE